MYFNRFMETAMNAPDAIFTPASNFSGDAPDTARFAELLAQSRQPFPASTKSYLSGAIHPGLRVPVRDIALTNGEQVSVYDTSGPYTDPAAQIDVRQGWPACAAAGSKRAATASSMWAASAWRWTMAASAARKTRAWPSCVPKPPRCSASRAAPRAVPT
jgi:hypothetical protein